MSGFVRAKPRQGEAVCSVLALGLFDAALCFLKWNEGDVGMSPPPVRRHIMGTACRIYRTGLRPFPIANNCFLPYY